MCLLVPDTGTMSAMVKREQKLRLAPSCQRALSLKRSSKHEIMKQIRLRVVREFNLPDNVSELLEVINVMCSILRVNNYANIYFRHTLVTRSKLLIFI